MRRHIAHALLAGGLAPIASAGVAAGGAHVVDDAAVEEAGHCHLESWVTFASGGSGLANLGPACTPRSLPNLEIDGFATRSWAPGTDDTDLGLASKLVLRSENHGLGVAVTGSFGYGVQRHRVEAASVIVPLTVPANRWLRLNFNLGWQWFRQIRRDELFLGAQAEIAIGRKLSLMAEGFGHDRGKAGQQLGLRWSPGRGHVDLDLIAGRYVDGVARDGVTLGVTVRR